MAHHSPILISLLVVFLCLASRAYSHDPVPDIKDICSKHTNPSFCEKALKAKAGSSLTCLAQYAIDSARDSAVINRATLNTMQQQTQEIRLKQHYHTCYQHYSDALDSLEKAKDYLDSKDYFGMNIAASAVMTNIDDCNSSEAPGYDPSVSLQKKNEDLENTSSIIMILANRLGGRQ